MASFDVVSLFTNIPLNEASEIVKHLVFQKNPVFHNLTADNFSKLLDLATRESYFTFNQNLYKQIDGVAMGSPLGPTLANIFMSHDEQKWLSECPQSFKPKLKRRYVDDTFLLFEHAITLICF